MAWLTEAGEVSPTQTRACTPSGLEMVGMSASCSSVGVAAVSGCSRGEAQLAREHPPAVPGPWRTVWRGAPPPLVLQAVAHGAGWRCGAAVDVVADVGRGGEAAVQRQPVQLVEDPSGQEEAHPDLPQLVRRQGEGEPG